MERIQKIIANIGYCSRRKAEELIQDGKVKVNGHLVKELGLKISSSDTIEIENVILDNNKNYEYYILNKPSGVLSSSSDDRGRKTVVELINTNERIYPVGRLDYDTTGLLILTNDGELTNKLTHPSNKIDKQYMAKIDGILDGYSIKRLREGVLINGIKSMPARVKVKKIDKKKNTCMVEIIIYEGKNHEIKNMIESVGYHVLKLKREKYAFLDLKDIKLGEYRRLTIKEVKKLYSLFSNK